MFLFQDLQDWECGIGNETSAKKSQLCGTGMYFV